MKAVHRTSDIIEARMLAHLLVEGGVDAGVEPGATDAGETGERAKFSVTVVEADEDKARAMLADWAAANPPDEQPRTPRRLNPWPLLVGLAAGLGIGWFAAGLAGGANTGDGQKFEFDRNADGKADLFYFYNQRGILTGTEADQNFDGRIDVRSAYDSAGQPSFDLFDADQNGTFESKTTYVHGVAQKVTTDTDGDGRADVVTLFKNGMASEVRILDPATDRVVRVEHFALGQLTSADVDSDGDGRLDTRNTYDRYENILTSTRF